MCARRANVRDPAMSSGPVPSSAPAPSSFGRWLPWLCAAGLLLAGLWLGSLCLALRTENIALRTEREFALIAREAAQTQLKERSLLAERMINDLGRELRDLKRIGRLQVVPLLPPVPTAEAAQVTVIWDSLQLTGILASRQLPPLREHQHYQLWVVSPTGRQSVKGGALPAGQDGSRTLVFQLDAPLAHDAGFALTLATGDGPEPADAPILLSGRP